MSDLINRQDAIKAIESLPNCYNGFSDTYDKAYIIGTLEEVPSADASLKQDRCKIDSDFINRAEAIKIVQTHPVVEALGKLTELPSAETEIIHCKDCKYRGRTVCPFGIRQMPRANDFCSYGKRREDDKRRSNICDKSEM